MVKLINFRKLSDNRYLSLDVNKLFDDENINTAYYTSIALIVFWMTTFPVVFFIIRKNIENKKIFFYFEKIFGFMFKEYKIKNIYWEVLKLMLLKYLIIILCELTQASVILRTNSVLALCFVYYTILCYFKPHINK